MARRCSKAPVVSHTAHANYCFPNSLDFAGIDGKFRRSYCLQDCITVRISACIVVVAMDRLQDLRCDRRYDAMISENTEVETANSL